MFWPASLVRVLPSLKAGPYPITRDSSVFFKSETPAMRLLLRIMVAWLCLLLAFGPLAFGAVQEWAIFTLEAGAAVAVMLWAVHQMLSRQLVIRGNVLLTPVLLFAALVCAQLLSGHTAYWYVTWKKALLWAAYGMIFFVATQCLHRRSNVKIFALFFTVFGFLVALFAVVQQFTWNGKLYWLVPNRYGGWVYGPYVNHAHYAGLMEMLVPIPLVLAMMNSWQSSLRALFAFIALLMASTIFLSRSLGGILAFAAQIVVLLSIAAGRKQARSQFRLLLILGVILAAWLVSFSPGGITQTLYRLHDPLSKSAEGNRLAIARDSLKMIAARPVLGWGLGTFPVVYPAFRSFYTNFFVNEAHNDYLQITVETGLLGFGLMCGFVVLLYRESLAGMERWRNDIRSAIALAATIGITGILVHSLSDFNLQIPANAALFFALAALATGSSWHSPAFPG